MSWPGLTSSTCCDEVLPPTDALEVLRKALLHPEAPWALQIHEHAVWAPSVSTTQSFQDAVGWLGLEVLLKQRHQRLCAVIARQEDRKHASDAGALASLHQTGSSSIALGAASRKRFRVDDETIEISAMQQRPRSLRTQVGATRGGSFTDWVKSLERNRDLESVQEFLGLAASANVVRCLFAVGVVAMWRVHGSPIPVSPPASSSSVGMLPITSLLRVMLLGHVDGVPSRANTVCWTASFLQTLYAHQKRDDAPRPRARMAEAPPKCDSHVEGLVQLLFPSEATSTLVDVFLTPALSTFAAASLTGPVNKVIGRRHSIMPMRETVASCCTVVAPFLSRGAFGGLDVPRGAKYYPAARQLQLLWVRQYEDMFIASTAPEADEYVDDESGSSDSDASAA